MNIQDGHWVYRCLMSRQKRVVFLSTELLAIASRQFTPKIVDLCVRFIRILFLK